MIEETKKELNQCFALRGRLKSKLDQHQKNDAGMKQKYDEKYAEKLKKDDELKEPLRLIKAQENTISNRMKDLQKEKNKLGEHEK